jgi:hypothetical protein
MTPKETPEDTLKKADPEPAGDQKHRKHGYRGYPNNPEIGGGIHTGTGFAGVGSAGNEIPARSSMLTEKTRESIEELGEQTEDEK